MPRLEFVIVGIVSLTVSGARANEEKTLNEKPVMT